MDRLKLRRVLPPVVVMLFSLIAISRPGQRGTWIALGIILLIVGLQWRERDIEPPDSAGT